MTGTPRSRLRALLPLLGTSLAAAKWLDPEDEITFSLVAVGPKGEPHPGAKLDVEDFLADLTAVVETEDPSALLADARLFLHEMATHPPGPKATEDIGRASITELLPLLVEALETAHARIRELEGSGR